MICTGLLQAICLRLLFLQNIKLKWKPLFPAGFFDHTRSVKLCMVCFHMLAGIIYWCKSRRVPCLVCLGSVIKRAYPVYFYCYKNVCFILQFTQISHKVLFAVIYFWWSHFSTWHNVDVLIICNIGRNISLNIVTLFNMNINNHNSHPYNCQALQLHTM